MAVSLKDVDPAFQGAGQKDGLEIWRIKNFCPVLVESSSHRKFFSGDSYVILKVRQLYLKMVLFSMILTIGLEKILAKMKLGLLQSKQLSLMQLLEDVVQYREVQGHKTEKFLYYFRPCIIPQQGGISSGFKHTEINAHEHVTRLFVCSGKHVVNVKEVHFAWIPSPRYSNLMDQILQFKKGLRLLKSCNTLKILTMKESVRSQLWDGKLMADADAGEFWGYFGGFAPLPRKVASEGDRKAYSSYMKLLWKIGMRIILQLVLVVNGSWCGNLVCPPVFTKDNLSSLPVEAESWTRKLLHL